MDIKDAVTAARREGRLSLDEDTGKRLLAGCGVEVPRSVVVSGVGSAEEGSADLRFPVVAKVMSAEILHKSDAGGVKVNLASPAAVRDAVETMADSPDIKGRQVDGYLVEEMAPAEHTDHDLLSRRGHYHDQIPVDLTALNVRRVRHRLDCVADRRRGGQVHLDP
ncbi:MAG: acetate--CoA ligase family protein, partial [Pseudomonadota bacterium]